MTDALEGGHQQGETYDNVGQDEGVETQEGSQNWEEQAKYFQSEKDKLHAENNRLKQYEELGHMLESRPDIVNAVTGMINGGQPAQQQPRRIELDKDEFDPWEAYNDPSSKSYKFRQQELQESINGAVTQQLSGFQKQQGVVQLQQQLAQHGLDEGEMKSFMEFASGNPARFGVEGAIKMWKSVAGSEPSNQQVPKNPLDGVRQTQQTPAAGGILQGQQPQVPKSDDQTMWDGIMKAGSRTNVLK
jgi:hypothetical protein